MKSLDNQIALITGGSSGIGLALARLLALQGCHVWLLARRIEQLKAALASLPGKVNQRHGILTADVSQWEAVQAAVSMMKHQIGCPDIVINAAGITHPGYVQELPLEIFERMMAVNYLGTVYTVKALLPEMIPRGTGHIVNISSVAGFLGVFGYSAYGASKYAVRGFTDVLRVELKPLGIQVSIVFPPDTDTPQLAYETPFKPAETRALSRNAGVLSAEQVAREILQGIQKNKTVILPGRETKILFFLHHVLGSRVYGIMDKLVEQARRSAGK
ncbi:MAG: SDR family oxidoreductase [Chloroflexota bacterium]